MTRRETVEAIREVVDEQNGYTVQELARETGASMREVQRGLEELQDRGELTSTPDWRYREARRDT
jgi:DeoR/GlpR family transcriptional regulator of sugar metabolism